MFLPVQNLVIEFSSTINNQKPRINQLDEDMAILSDDIKALKGEVSSVPRRWVRVKESSQVCKSKVLCVCAGAGQRCGC